MRDMSSINADKSSIIKLLTAYTARQLNSVDARDGNFGIRGMYNNNEHYSTGTIRHGRCSPLNLYY